MSYNDKFAFWKANVYDEEIRNELNRLEGDEAAKENCFFKDLSFGTAGIRGVLGAGPNCINIYTVARAVKAYAVFLKNKKAQTVAVSFDSRHNSQRFAQIASCILANSGLKVFLAHTMQPTPFLSFAIRTLRADGGIMFTASHNPKEYNGFKFYNNTGCQINDSAVAEISSEMAKIDYFSVPMGDLTGCLEEEKIEYITDKLKRDYLDAVWEISPLPAKDVKVMYSPLNGTGWHMVPRILKRAGVKEVKTVTAQSFPNEKFTTCPLPDPQKPQAFDLAIEEAKREKSDLIILTDPDCDRMGLAVLHKGEYVVLDGNAVAALMTEFVLYSLKQTKRMPQHPVIVKSLVTTPMIDKIGDVFDAHTIETMIGFKNIGAKVTELEFDRQRDFVMGMEESCGYLIGDRVREKDAVVASLVAAQMCSALKRKNLTLVDKFKNLKMKYGNFKNKQISYEFSVADGEKRKKELLDYVRTVVGEEINGIPVTEKIDLRVEKYKDFGRSDMLIVEMIHGNRMVIRPSGTEPLIKLYLFANESDKQGDVVLDAMVRWADRIFN